LKLASALAAFLVIYDLLWDGLTKWYLDKAL
jgi:hypothetical protein